MHHTNCMTSSNCASVASTLCVCFSFLLVTHRSLTFSRGKKIFCNETHHYLQGKMNWKTMRLWDIHPRLWKSTRMPLNFQDIFWDNPADPLVTTFRKRLLQPMWTTCLTVLEWQFPTKLMAGISATQLSINFFSFVWSLFCRTRNVHDCFPLA